MTSQLTRNYWIEVFSGWVSARDMPGPQNNEALQVISEIKASETRAVKAEQERYELRAAYLGSLKTIEQLRRQLEQMAQERDEYKNNIVEDANIINELRRQLKRAQCKIDALSTQLGTVVQP